MLRSWTLLKCKSIEIPSLNLIFADAVTSSLALEPTVVTSLTPYTPHYNKALENPRLTA